MRGVNFRSRVWFYTGILTAVVLLTAFGVLAAIYYRFSVNSIKNDLIRTAREISDNQIVVEDGKMLFKKDSEERTISAYLRDKNMSAILYDRDLKVAAAYGVYRRLAEENLLTDFGGEIKEGAEFREIHYYPEEEYYTLTVPILYRGEREGAIQVASQTVFFSRTKEVGLYLLLSVMLGSMLISWPLSRMLINYLFKPLEEMAAAMEGARLSNLNIPLDYRGKTDDEIGMLVVAYNSMLARIAEGVERQKTFVANASHELKTPIARTITSLDVMAGNMEDKNYPAVAADIKKTKEELFAFARLIEELLLLSRTDGGKLKLNYGRVALVPFLEEVKSLFAEEIKSKELTVESNVGRERAVRADPVYLKVILSNLLSNAIKYSRQKGKIKIRAEEDGGSVSVSIRDEGAGMSNFDYAHVFDRFFRSSRTAAASGFGVGMALVKQLGDLHKIEIKYNRKISGGTMVTLAGLKAVAEGRE